MHQTKHVLFLVTLLMLTSCFKAFEPDIEGSDFNKLVVSGQVTDFSSYQIVKITRSSSINEQHENPVTSCIVTISDNQGHQFPMIESDKGNYRGIINPEYFIPGSSFKIEILMPDGNKIVSDFDKFSSCPKVDSVYYIRKDISTSDPLHPQKGIQFYVDLNGDNTDSRFYRFEAIETWEYHSEYPKQWYYDYYGLHYLTHADFSKSVCWRTFLDPSIYILSTKKLTANEYSLSPLTFVDNITPKLVYGYSLLLNQYSLSEAAYKYWEQLRINSFRQGGLYEKQPLAAEGNLHNITHPDQIVLGFFGISSVKTKRIFVRNVENLELETESSCAIVELTGFHIANLRPPDILYLLADSLNQPSWLLEQGCVDCRDLHGTIIKPDFWPY